MICGYARVSTVGQAKDGNSFEVQEKLLSCGTIKWSLSVTVLEM